MTGTSPGESRRPPPAHRRRRPPASTPSAIRVPSRRGHEPRTRRSAARSSTSSSAMVSGGRNCRTDGSLLAKIANTPADTSAWVAVMPPAGVVEGEAHEHPLAPQLERHVRQLGSNRSPSPTTRSRKLGASTTSRVARPATQPSSALPERRHVHERVVVEELVELGGHERGGDRVHPARQLPAGDEQVATPSWTWYRRCRFARGRSGPRRRPTTHLARRTGPQPGQVAGARSA